MLDVRDRRGDRADRGRAEDAVADSDERECADAGDGLELGRGDVPVRDAVAERVKERPRCQRCQARVEQGAGGGTAGDVERDDHGMGCTASLKRGTPMPAGADESGVCASPGTSHSWHWPPWPPSACPPPSAPARSDPAATVSARILSSVRLPASPSSRRRGSLPSRTSQEPAGFLIARPRGGSLALHSSPRGPVVARLGATTEFGSPLRLGVVKDRGKWLGVASTRLPNGKLGWVKRSEVYLSRTEVSLHLDLSRRLLLMKRGDTVIRRMVVGVGRPSSPTPRGRFAVTDKLSGYRYSAAYGCCIVALSAHQPNLPSGWTGGDRIAIHGTNVPSSIGVASSAGCPHAGYADMQALMRRVPLGAPVFIRA